MKGFKFIFFFFSLLLYGCETCSNCSISYSNALCECNLGGGLIQIFNIDGITDDEIQILKADCETMGDCTWSHTTSEKTEEEVCGKQKELNNRVAYLTNDGWSCQ